MLECFCCCLWLVSWNKYVIQNVVLVFCCCLWLVSRNTHVMQNVLECWVVFAVVCNLFLWNKHVIQNVLECFVVVCDFFLEYTCYALCVRVSSAFAVVCDLFLWNKDVICKLCLNVFVVCDLFLWMGVGPLNLDKWRKYHNKKSEVLTFGQTLWSNAFIMPRKEHI